MLCDLPFEYNAILIYTASCLLDYPYFQEHYKAIAIQALNADQKSIEQINLIKLIKI